jgi:hypothetical protein
MFNLDLLTAEEPEENHFYIQPQTEQFNFDIITNTNKYKENVKYAEENDLVRDICDEQYSNLNDEELAQLDESLYIHVVQKSPSWLRLRELSCGTASNIGKYLYNKEVKFSNIREVCNLWEEKLQKNPFEKTHTTDGHMSWGVKYEDLALIHLAIEEKVGVIQVGSIKVELIDILNLGKQIYGKNWIDLNLDTHNKYILVSPDGIVGKPEAVLNPKGTYKELLGMLEIKCISPFHHISTIDNKLKWVENIQKREWHSADKIPYVYIVQQALQAISGVLFYNMKSNHIMWFIRWSPTGMSIFKFKFIDLVKLGVLVANLYFSFYNKIKTEEDIQRLYPLANNEAKLETMIEKQYLNVINNAQFKYVKIEDYPEFNEYYKSTRNNVFYVNESYLN